MKKLVPIVSITLPIALAMSGCETPGRSAGLGAAIGGAVGAVASRGRPWGILQGAALGAANESLFGGLVAGAIGAVAGTLGGYEFRSRLVRATGGKDLPIALLEDVIAVGSAFLIVSRF